MKKNGIGIGIGILLLEEKIVWEEVLGIKKSVYIYIEWWEEPKL